MSDPFVFDHNRLFNEPTMEQHGSHMIIKNVQKPEKTKYVTIDTCFRDQYDTSLLANYNITLPERINSVKSMKVLSLEMPLSYHNVSSSLGNNSFQLKNSATLAEEVIVVGDNFYPTSTFPTPLNSVFSASGSGWINGGITITFNSTSGKMTLANSNAVDVQITFDTVECTGGTGPKGGLSKNESLMSKLGWLLGFRLPSYTIPKSGGSITGEAIANFSGIPYFYLILDEFKNSNPHSFIGLSRTSQLSSQQILARITPNYQDYAFSENSFPTMFHAECGDHMVSDTRTYGELVNIQRMNVRIVDEFGRVIDLNGLDFSFCLELEHV